MAQLATVKLTGYRNVVLSGGMIRDLVEGKIILPRLEPEQKQPEASSLFVLLDISNSMLPELPALKATAHALIDVAPKNGIKLYLITFAAYPQLIGSPFQATINSPLSKDEQWQAHQAALHQVVTNLACSSGTNLSAPLELALSLASQHQVDPRRAGLFLLTDGTPYSGLIGPELNALINGPLNRGFGHRAAGGLGEGYGEDLINLFPHHWHFSTIEQATEQAGRFTAMLGAAELDEISIDFEVLKLGQGVLSGEKVYRLPAPGDEYQFVLLATPGDNSPINLKVQAVDRHGVKTSWLVPVGWEFPVGDDHFMRLDIIRQCTTAINELARGNAAAQLELARVNLAQWRRELPLEPILEVLEKAINRGFAERAERQEALVLSAPAHQTPIAWRGGREISRRVLDQQNVVLFDFP